MAKLLKERETEGLYDGYETSKANQRGQMGERIISTVLQKYLPAHYLLIDDIYIRTMDFEMTQADHLVLHPQFIVCIETKNLTGRLRVFDSNYWEQQNIKGEWFKIDSPQLQSLTHTMHLSAYLKSLDVPIPIYTLVVLTSEKTCSFEKETDVYNKDCPVLYGKELIPYILGLEKELKEEKERVNSSIIGAELISEHEGIMRSPLFSCKRAAINENDVEAQYYLGKMYLEGFFQQGSNTIKVKKDYSVAKMWLRRAKKQNHKLAADLLRKHMREN